MFGFRTLSQTLIVTSALLLIAPSAERADAPTTADAIAAIQAFGQRALAEQGAPRMSVAITDRTHTFRILTFGYSNAEAKTPATPQTRFIVGEAAREPAPRR